jgi:hypothetical protein
MASGPYPLATAVHSDTSRSDGSGWPPANTSTVAPPSRSGPTTLATAPAFSSFASVTTNTRRAGRRWATSPSWATALRPNTSDPAEWNDQVVRMATSSEERATEDRGQRTEDRGQRTE